MILVTGATGNVGAEAVQRLLRAGESVRALVHARPSAPTDGVQFVSGDFDDSDSVERAVDGVSTVVLVSPAVPAQEIAVIDAAVRAGVTHVVKASSKASPNSPVERRRGQSIIEQHLRESGIGWTLLRSNAYQQNLFALAPSVRAGAGFVMSAADGEVGMVDARDVTTVAATVAAAPLAHTGRTYWPTGPALVTYDDVATALTEILGSTVEYRRAHPAQHQQAMIAAGVPEAVARSNAEAFRLIGEGDAAWITDDVEVLTGTAPLSVQDFLAEHRERFLA